MFCMNFTVADGAMFRRGLLGAKDVVSLLHPKTYSAFTSGHTLIKIMSAIFVEELS